MAVFTLLGPCVCWGWGEKTWCSKRAFLWCPAALSEEELCLLGALPSFQNLQEVFSVAASEHTASSKNQLGSQGSLVSALLCSLPPPWMHTWREGCLEGRRVRNRLPSLLASPLTTGKFSTISIISGIKPHCRKTDFPFREEGRWGLVRE